MFVLLLALFAAVHTAEPAVSADVHRVQEIDQVREYARIVIRFIDKDILYTRLCGPSAFYTFFPNTDSFACVTCASDCLAAAAVFPEQPVVVGKECICNDAMNIFDYREYAQANGNSIPAKYFRAGTLANVGTGSRQRFASAVWSAGWGVPVTFQADMPKQEELRQQGRFFPSVTRDTLWWAQRVDTSFGVDRNLRDVVKKMPVESDVIVMIWPLDVVRDLLPDVSITLTLGLEMGARVFTQIEIPSNTILRAVAEDSTAGANCVAADLKVVVDQMRSIQRLVQSGKRGGLASELSCSYGVTASAMSDKVAFNAFSVTDQENLFPGRLKYFAAYDTFSFELMKIFSVRGVLHCDDMYRWILRRVDNLVKRSLSYTSLSAWQACWSQGLNVVRQSAVTADTFLSNTRAVADQCVADRDGRAEFAKRVFETSVFLGRLYRRRLQSNILSAGRLRALRMMHLWELCTEDVYGVFDRNANLRVGRRCKRDTDCRWTGLRCLTAERKEDEERYDSQGFCSVPRGVGAARVVLQCVYERLGKRMFTSLKLELLSEVESNQVTPSGSSLLYTADTTNRLVDILLRSYSINLCVGPKTPHPLAPSARDRTLETCQATRSCNWNILITDAISCENNNDEPSFCGVTASVTWALQQGHRSVCRLTSDIDGLINQSQCWQAYRLALEAEKKCIAQATSRTEAQDCYILGPVHSSALLTCMRNACSATSPPTVNFDNQACGVTGRDSPSLCMDECRSVSAPSPVAVATCYRDMNKWETERDCHMSAAGDTQVIHHIDGFNERLSLDMDLDSLSRPRYCSIRVYLAGRALPASTSTAAYDKAYALLRAFEDMRNVADSRDQAYAVNITLSNDLSQSVVYEVKTGMVNGSIVRVSASATSSFTGAWLVCDASCNCDCDTCVSNGSSLGYLCSSVVTLNRRDVMQNTLSCTECQTCCSDFCAQQDKCELDKLFFPQLDNSSYVGTNRPQPVVGTSTGQELRIIDTLSECNRAFSGHPNVHYDALAPWTPSSPTLNRFEADKCLSLSGVCLFGVGLTPPGLSASNKGWQWQKCFDDSQSFSGPSAGRRLSSITTDPPLSYPTSFQDTLQSKHQFLEWDATMGSGRGACFYRKPDPFELFGGVTSLQQSLSLDALGWPASFQAAGQIIADKLQLASLPARDESTVSTWKSSYASDQTCQSSPEDTYTEYTPTRFWFQGQNNDQQNCESQMCDLDPKVSEFDECSSLEGCSADCWMCVSNKQRNQQQGVCILEDPSITRDVCESALNGEWVEGQVLSAQTGQLAQVVSSMCALINKSLQFCVSEHERIVYCSDFGTSQTCENDAIANILQCSVAQQKCQRKEDCLLAGICESDAIDGLFSGVYEDACIVTSSDAGLLYYELCDEDLSVCFFPLSSGYGMHVIDLGTFVDFATADTLFAGILGRAKSGHSLLRPTTARAAPFEPMTLSRCNAVSQAYPHLRTAFITRPRTRLECEGMKGCCVRFDWDKCVEYAPVADENACGGIGGIWGSVWKWIQKGVWKTGSLIGNGNKQWNLRRFTSVNNFGVEVDVVKVKNILFSAVSNNIVNEHASEVVREILEPLIVSLEVIAALCGRHSATQELTASLKTSMIDSSKYGLSFSSAVFPLRAGVTNSLLPGFSGIRVNHGAFLIQDTTPSPTASLLNDTLVNILPSLFLTIHPAETLMFGNAANQYALPSRFKYLTAKRLAYLASLPVPPPPQGVNLSVPTWNVVGGSVSYPTAILEWMVRLANPTLYTTTPAPILSEDEQKRQQEITAQLLDSDAKLYWTYNATLTSSAIDPVELHKANASACGNTVVNSQGVVVGQVAGDCVSLTLSEVTNSRNAIEVCWPIDFEHPYLIRNESLAKLDVGRLVTAARVILETDVNSGITIPDDRYGLTRVGNSWVEPLGRRVEVRGSTFCSHYLVGEDETICPILRTSNEEAFPETFSDDATELSSSCNFIEPFLDGVQAKQAAHAGTRGYTPLASQQQAFFDRYHDGADIAIPPVQYEYIFVDGPEYQSSISTVEELPLGVGLILSLVITILIR